MGVIQINSWQQQEIFLFEMSKLALGPSQPPVQWVWGFFARCEFDCCPLGLRLGMSGIIPLLPLIAFFAHTGTILCVLFFFNKVSAVMVWRSSAGSMVKERLDLESSIYKTGQACCFTWGCTEICLNLWRAKGSVEKLGMVWYVLLLWGIKYIKYSDISWIAPLSAVYIVYKFIWVN